MPILRNPFRRTPGDHVNDENARPNGNTGTPNSIAQRRGEADASGAKPMTIDLSDGKMQDKEYKLSEINDSGVYLPPSPPEKKSFWSSKATTTTKSTRNALNENEPFNISRESFDSYRRSFDISARSPVIDSSPHRSRQSLDVRAMRIPSSQSFSTQASFASRASFASMRSGGLSQHPSQRSIQTLSSQNPTEPLTPSPASPATDCPKMPAVSPYALSPSEAPELPPAALPFTSETIPEPDHDRFEEVTLNDPKPKRHGIFSRFGGGSLSSPAEAGEGISRPSSGTGHSFFGRKRGASGQGAELGSFPSRAPVSRGTTPGPAPVAATQPAPQPTQHQPILPPIPQQPALQVLPGPAPQALLQPTPQTQQPPSSQVAAPPVIKQTSPAPPTAIQLPPPSTTTPARTPTPQPLLQATAESRAE